MARNVAHPFASQKVDKLILEETEAGRRFLATLRRNHERELEASDAPGTRQLTAKEGATVVAARSLAKDKRSSLRATLEHLIVRYLRRLTSDDDAEGDDGGDEPGGYEVAARYRRQSLPAADSDGVGNSLDASASNAPAAPLSSSMEITLLTNDTDTNLTESWEQWDDSNRQQHQLPPPDSSLTGSDVAGYGSSAPSDSGLGDGTGGAGGESVASEGRGASDASGVGVSANGDGELRDNGDEVVAYNPPPGESEVVLKVAELKQPKQGKAGSAQRGECDSVRKRVSQLDRFELERSMRNGSFREYNIRNALNYR
uniref:Uncharacterized protein n=1 Tax=Anopheles dirus TaxID=7168 RepID=A0A182NF99_9DIPT